MEPDQCTWEKPLKEMLYKAIVFLSEKINVINKAALIGLVFMVAYSYLAREVQFLYRRACQFKEELSEFTRAYRQAILGDRDEDDDDEVIDRRQVREYMMKRAQKGNQNVKRDVVESVGSVGANGSSDDDYESDMEDMVDVGTDFATAIAEHRRRQEALARQREQVRIAETIEFDEYLLSKGLIDESEFGKTIMVEF